MAAGATYEPIATTTLGSAAASITFSSIAASWTDLRVVIVPTGTLDARDCYMRFNSDSAANYSRTTLRGNGTSAISQTGVSATELNLSTGSGGVSNTIPYLIAADIFSYAGSTYKTVLSETNGDKNGSGNVIRYVHLWRSTSAITSIVLSLESGGTTFAAGTTATLYGIKAA